MATPIITLRNVSVQYPEGDRALNALNNVSLDIYPEEYIIFFGPSGCGKSTLLYTISGLESVGEGTVEVSGHNLATMTVAEKVDYHRRAVGMVFQAYYLIPSLSVRANVALPQIFLGKEKTDRITQAESLLERFGILDQKGKLPNQLSGGQQQRVAIARSLISDPPILLADEPVGNLDSKSADDVMRLLAELNEKDKKTIVVVTHNPNHLNYAHRIFYMKDGKIVRESKNIARVQVREETMRPYRSEGLGELAQSFPFLDEGALKAKMIGRYLLAGLEVDREDLFEHAIKSMIEGTISQDEFVNIAARSPREWGLGLYEPHAKKLGDEIAAVLGMARYLKKNFGIFPHSYEEYHVVLERIGTYLLLTSRVKLSDQERGRFESAIKGRLEGSLNHSSFTDVLDRPFGEKGVGLNVRTAYNIARMLELIMVDYGPVSPLPDFHKVSTMASQTLLDIVKTHHPAV